MNSLKTHFAGLELANPVIISSCGRTDKPENNRRLQEAGAAAIVLKSLFEENIVRQTQALTDVFAHSEESGSMQGYLRSQMLHEYLDLVRESKQRCSIPIIASINCFSNNEWQEFAARIQEAGADALELNVMSIRTSVDYNDGDVEKRHVQILKAVKKCVSIPVTVKLGANLSNPVNLISRLQACGADGAVLFNRSYKPDIDIDSMEFTSGYVFSNESDLAEPLRWTGIASAAVDGIDFAVSGGVRRGEDIVKSILVGAAAVEVCSVIYQQGDAWIARALDKVREWQYKNGFSQPDQYRGRMDASGSENAERLDRVQFLRYFESQA